MKILFPLLINLLVAFSSFLFDQMPCFAQDLRYVTEPLKKQYEYQQEFSFHQKQMKQSFKTTYGKFVLLRSRSAGMFAVFADVLALCKNYEAGHHIGFEVNFEKSGLYYDKEHGPNWWSYYCEPLIYSNESENKKKNLSIYQCYPYSQRIVERETSRSEAHSLIRKYIHIKQDIQNEVDEFVERHFLNHYVISVHYRGTDKVSQVPRVEFEKVKESLLKVMNDYENENIKIFVASDEELFIEFMTTSFGEIVCYNQNVMRSENNNPIHIGNTSPYQSGREALIDCLILARGSFLIRTSSNLSLWSSFFNPEMPVLELSRRG